MNKPNVSKLFKAIRTGANKKSPEILIGLGVAGMITTTVLAVKATPKALELIEAEKRKQNCDKDYTDDRITKLKPVEVVKTTWKCYIPAVVTGAVSIACLIGSNSVNARRNAALATAYKLSETALSEYKEKVVEEIGEQKEKIIREKINQDHVDKNPASKSTIVITNNGDTLCYDGVSGRYFKSSINTIEKAINNLNRTMNYDMYVSLSEFYDELGLEHTDVSDQLGWNLDDGLLEIEFDTRFADDGTPCITLEYRVSPRYDFSKLM